MSLWDSADILARCKRALNRPSTDEALSDADWYAFATEAQSRVYTLLATHCPEAVYSAPTLMSTSDDGATYTFGTDSGLPTSYQNVFAMGHVEIRSARAGQLLLPGTDWDEGGETYVPDGDKIRWPGGRTRTFSDGPYARFVQPPGVIDGSTAPTLEPAFARILIVDDAVTRAAERLKLDTSSHEARFHRDWMEILLALKTQYFGQGQVALGGVSGVWWRRDFAR